MDDFWPWMAGFFAGVGFGVGIGWRMRFQSELLISASDAMSQETRMRIKLQETICALETANARIATLEKSHEELHDIDARRAGVDE